MKRRQGGGEVVIREKNRRKKRHRRKKRLRMRKDVEYKEEGAELTFVAESTFAPSLRSSATTSTWPSLEERCRALSPF